MFKKILFSLFVLLCVHSVSSQEFAHGVGLGLWFNNGHDIRRNSTFVLIYSPRINVVSKDNYSISVGLPVRAGTITNYVYYIKPYGEEVSGTNILVLNAAVMANYNFSAGASKSATKRVGYFGGIGFSGLYGSYLESNFNKVSKQYDKFYGYAFGPAANLGVRFANPRKRKRNVEVNAFYMHSVNKIRVASLNIATLYHF